MKLKACLLFLTTFIAGVALMAQSSVPDNWFNLDAAQSEVQGVSTNKVYNTLLKGKKSQTVIVAIIDSGVDAEHEDLADVMWRNPGEIPGNGIDDDKNGYIDDVHGWNFIGGKDGNINQDNLEVARLVNKYRKKFKNAKPESLSKEDKALYAKFQKMEKEVEEKQSSASAQLAQMESTKLIIMEALDGIDKALDGKDFNKENIEAIEAGGDRSLMVGKNIILESFAQGSPFESLEEVKEDFDSQIKEASKYFDTQANYHYNPDFNPRSIVGDNYANQTEKHYGNNDVKGPDAFHGTHVAGIVAAKRNNGLGMDGVADNVRIMSVRAVPDGDERDKDVANAITREALI